ncbi:hypothetical protein GCM10025789_02260 [Tessaracoccus lubricantis]|uniref:Osmotically inducible protein OsmC n=1 Tax=Tessaracoccus lubricantis TaxID=545543 RepID=A0ABP9EYA0_9ACTN
MAHFVVTVGAGTLRPTSETAVHFPHRWTDEGVGVEAAFTGGHLWVLAPAGCVLNDVYREAAGMGLEIDGVLVSATGGLDEDTWQSTGISYAVEIDSPEDPEVLDELVATVDSVAEIPKALRTGTTVRRV